MKNKDSEKTKTENNQAKIDNEFFSKLRNENKKSLTINFLLKISCRFSLKKSKCDCVFYLPQYITKRKTFR